MPANEELLFIAKLVEEGNFRLAVDEGVSAECFADDGARQLWNDIAAFYESDESKGTVPTRERLEEKFPHISLPRTSRTPLAVHIKDLLDYRTNRELGALCDDILDNNKKHKDVDALLARSLSRLEAVSKDRRIGKDIEVSSYMQETMARYERYENPESVQGIPYPWKPLNEETRGIQNRELIVLYGRPKSMKCVPVGQKIMLRDGSLVPIEQLPESLDVPSYTEKTGKTRWARARRVVSGEKDSVEVETESGLLLRTSTEHLYMVPGGGYRRICELQPGDYVATARRLPETEPSSKIETDEAQLLGMLVGDGNYTRDEVQFTTEDEELKALVERLSSSLFNCELHQETRPIEYRIVRASGKHNLLLDRLHELGMHGKKGPDKEVPESIFRSSPASVAAFLAGLLDTDGHVSRSTVSWSSASRKLLEGVQHLLSRFGIRGRIQELVTNFDTFAYMLVVYSKEQHQQLHEVLGSHLCLTRKRQALERLAMLDVMEKRNADAVPYSDRLMAQILEAKVDKPWPRWGGSKLDASKFFRRTGRISRHLLQLLARALESPELQKVADSDIIWERIKSIEHLGVLPCYDICIEDGQDPNFVVENFIVHNTWVLLSMAVHAYNHNRRVLVYTREMSPEQMMDRTACLLINAPYSAYRKGRLDQIAVWEGGTMKDRLRTLMDTVVIDEETCRLESGFNKGFIITTDQSRRGEYGGGVEGLKQKIRDHNPDIIYVDAAYLMKNDKSGKRSIKWEDQADIVTELKETAMVYRRPIVITTQANRDSEDSRGYSVRNIAFADAYGMNADLCMEVNKEETGDPERNLLALCIPAAREINLYGFVIHGNAATDFGVVMRKKRNDEGVVLTNEAGEPQTEPVIFYQRKDVAAFFKGSDNLKAERKKNSDGPRTPAALSNIVHTVAAKAFKGKKEKGKN